VGAAMLVMLIKTMMMMFWFGVVTGGDFIFLTAAFRSPHRKQFRIQLRLLAESYSAPFLYLRCCCTFCCIVFVVVVVSLLL